MQNGQESEPQKENESASSVTVKDSKNEQADNEDSLNLTIGEEDEKLFNEDVSSYTFKTLFLTSFLQLKKGIFEKKELN